MNASISHCPALARRVTVATIAGLIWLGCYGEQAELTAPESGIRAVQDVLRPAMNVQDRHTERLLAIPGVVGTAVGLRADGRPAIKIFTAYAGVAGLPDWLDGFPVVVEVTGMFFALSDPTTRFTRPVPTGVSTGHPAITAGTIGARVRDAAGNVYALSNNHVYANQNDANIGDSGLQPGPADGGNDPGDKIGELYDYEPLDFSLNGSNTMDAAIVLSSTDLLGNSTPEDDGYGTPSSTTASAFVGQQVQKYGRTTRLTHGEVSEVNVTVEVCYEVFIIWCTKSAIFVNQIAITPGTFSDGGDSGSLIITDDLNKYPVGLLFAGSSTHTLANPIDVVLSRFGVSIDDAGPGPPQPVTDIAVTAVTAPASVTQGDMVNVDVTVKNVGNQGVSSDINVTLTDDTDGVTIGTQTISGGLAADASTVLNYTWDTNGASIGDHTLTARHDLPDDNAANDSKSTTVTVTQAPDPSTGMHVGDLDPYNSSEGKTWTAYVILKVEDESHNPLEGATVYGSWNPGGLAVDECTTDYAGECLMLRTLIPKRTKSATFTVVDVVYPTLSYVESSNHDPDGDSDGTRITVNKP